jgi:hypothetical protein
MAEIVRLNPSGFRWPPGDSRTTLIGATGSGKTTAGLWFLSNARFDLRPWIVIDFKREILFDQVGFPPIRDIGWKLPGKKERGLFLLNPLPGQDVEVENFLWRVWDRGNIGLFIDEASLIPDTKPIRAVLHQGRSKRIPTMACTQRPVDVPRAFFSEASFLCLWRVTDDRDLKIVRGFMPIPRLDLPERHWLWFDVARNRLLRMRPVPPPRQVVDELRDALRPYDRQPLFGWFTPPPQAREV